MHTFGALPTASKEQRPTPKSVKQWVQFGRDAKHTPQFSLIQWQVACCSSYDESKN